MLRAWIGSPAQPRWEAPCTMTARFGLDPSPGTPLSSAFHALQRDVLGVDVGDRRQGWDGRQSWRRQWPWWGWRHGWRHLGSCLKLSRGSSLQVGCAEACGSRLGSQGPRISRASSCQGHMLTIPESHTPTEIVVLHGFYLDFGKIQEWRKGTGSSKPLISKRLGTEARAISS